MREKAIDERHLYHHGLHWVPNAWHRVLTDGCWLNGQGKMMLEEAGHERKDHFK